MEKDSFQDAIEELSQRFNRELVFEPARWNDLVRVRRWGPGHDADESDYMPGHFSEDDFDDGKLTKEEMIARCEDFMRKLSGA